MSTIEALEHIEQGIVMCPTTGNDQHDHLTNLQFKASCLLDCLTRISKSREAIERQIDLMNSSDSGLVQLHTMPGRNYRQSDSSRSIIYALEDEPICVAILKVTRPRLVYYLQLTTTGGRKLYTIPLRDEVCIDIDKNRLEVQLPDYNIEGFVTFNLSEENIQIFIDHLDEYLVPYNCVEKDEAAGEPVPTLDSYPHGLVRGAGVLSSGLKRGAMKTGEFIAWGTPFVISKLSKSESVEVTENWKNTATIAKTVSTTAASVTGKIADTVGNATMASE